MSIKSLAVATAYLCLTGCSSGPVVPSCPSVLAGWTQPKDGMEPHGWHATVTLKEDRVLWDGASVDEAEFKQRLQNSTKISPVLHILFDPTNGRSCKQAKRVRDEIDRLADCQAERLCGQGKLDEFKRLRDSGAVWRVKQPDKSRSR